MFEGRRGFWRVSRYARKTQARLFLLLALGLGSLFEAPAVGAPTPEFSLHDLTRPPFARVSVWAPSEATDSYETLLLLHGNQEDATRMFFADLREQQAFRRRILIVPALPGPGYAWEKPETTRALAQLVDDVARRYPVDRKRIYVLGYSAGGSRVLAVAKAMGDDVAGIVSVAGDVARTVRSSLASISSLARVPMLLICNSEDHGPNASCELDARNRALLAKHGARAITTHRLEATHAIDFAQLAPVLDTWLRERR
jgi:poly(3-hydroxybutyrate) depolymerase